MESNKEEAQAAAGPDNATLLSLLKDKAKELKTLQKKLDKVEEKFF
jgi:hypothetical protein